MTASLSGFGQQLKQRWSSIADPSLGKIQVTDMSDNVLNADNLKVGQLIKLSIPVINGGDKELPAGSCKVKIGLGSKLMLDPNFVLSTAKLNNYFAWTSVVAGGQSQITGELISPLPGDFKNISVYFRVAGTRAGTSTITANFLVSNHHTENTLSDFDATNNTSYLQYNLKGSVKGVFTNLDVNKTGCTINVAFTTNNDINVSKYEVEVSKDKVNYVKVGEATARSQVYYNNFELTNEIKSSLIYVRIKSINQDGSYAYSDMRSVGGSCEKPWVLNLYPNPVTAGVKSVVISAKEGVFNGKYKVSIVDAAGKQMQVKEVELKYVTQFKYDVGMIGAGQYMVQVVNEDGNQSAVLKFEKL